MAKKLIIEITLSVTSEDGPGAKYYIDPEAVRAADVVLVQCPFGIDAKALDASKIIQGALPGVIEEHLRLRNLAFDKLKARQQRPLLELAAAEADRALSN